MLYQDINLDITLKEFQDINTNLKKNMNLFQLINIMNINL